jgi:GT2 family glycosyltransferase
VRTCYTLFLDDDVELASDYIEQMERLFAADPTIVGASGGVAADGAPARVPIDRRVAARAIREYTGSRDCVPFKDVYGCNMFVRSDVLQVERFDERLPLYGWLEDLDFSLRLKKHGRIVRHRGALVAHLATRSGRTSDLRYGYTKIANPWYLWRKKVLSSLPEVIVRYWVKTTLANLLRAFLSNGPPGVDYRKRLIGNLMAYRDLTLFRLDPQNILNIDDSTEKPVRTPSV